MDTYQPSSTARLFIAIPVPQKAKESLSQVLAEYSDYIERTIPPANWHITVCFLGGKVENYEQYIEKLTKPMPQSFLPTATVTHMGRGVKPHLLWAYLNRTVTLHSIREDIVKRLEDMNFPMPKDIRHEFIPHITVAHFAKEHEKSAIADRPVNITWPVKEAILYRSMSGPEGVYYEPLSSIPFTT